MNPFTQRFAAVAVPSLLDHFGERKAGDDDQYEPVEVLLNDSTRPFRWPKAIVGELTEELIEKDGRLYSKQICMVTGATSSLRTGSMALPESVQVKVPKYGNTPFHVMPQQSKYGGPMTTLMLVRTPIVELASFQDRERG